MNENYFYATLHQKHAAHCSFYSLNHFFCQTLKQCLLNVYINLCLFMYKNRYQNNEKKKTIKNAKCGVAISGLLHFSSNLWFSIAIFTQRYYKYLKKDNTIFLTFLFLLIYFLLHFFVFETTYSAYRKTQLKYEIDFILLINDVHL